MGIDNKDLVTRLLKQSILSLCRETVTYTRRLEIDGIICLTVDDQDQHVVKIHEFFGRPHVSENENIPTRSTVYHGKHENVHESCKLSKSTSENAEKNFSHQIKLEAENMEIKHESDNDAFSSPEAKGEDGSRKDLPHQGSKSNAQTCSDNLTYVDYTGLDDKKLNKSSATNILCKKCNCTLENVELFQVHNMTSHNHFTCLVCLSTFTSRNNMKRHIRLHTGIKPYSCHKCPESFSRNDDFKRHLLKHTFQKPFRCALCKTGYSDRTCVKSHMIKEHNSQVYHVCPHCGESYIDIIRFQQHKKIHSELQDYSCSICSFTGSSALMYNKHILTHGPLKEYKCTHCDLSFSDPFMYTSHMKGHRCDERVQEYNCCFCDMTFQSFEQFQRHEHTHVHSKQHVCEICNKVFRYPSNLREHMLTHLPKSTYQGVRNLIPTSDHTANNQFLKKDDTDLTMTLKDESSSHNFNEMETDEENNNKINSDNVNSLEKSELTADGETISGCSDYWCAECSHGFGTERELQNHISNTHEGNDDIAVEGHEVYGSTNNQSKTEMTDPLEDSSLTDNPHYNVYTDKTVTNAIKSFDSCTTNNVKTRTLKNAPENDMEQELNTVTDAMRQVKDIQSEFGIKSIGLDPLKISDRKEQTEKRPSENGSNNEEEHIWLKPSVNNLFRAVPKLSVSLIGTKMKIQRTNISSFSHTDTGAVRFPKHSRSTDDATPPPGTEISKQNNSHNKPSIPEKLTKNSPTSLNLKVRNPGFERVVTPDVLFKTKAPFTCEVCEETFKNFDEFHEHGVKVHRRYICSYCGKVFTSRPNRERHIRYHTGEKPYTCELCQASFLRGDDLKYHRTTKHADIKPFTCRACQTSFSLPKDLEKHLKIYPDHKL